MEIACLAWGSLVWDPRGLPYVPPWQPDGPMAPVEFSRQSYDGRITLVLDPEAAPIRLHWARMASRDLAAAREALRQREGIPPDRRDRRIGTWQHGGEPPALIADLPDWAAARRLDAVIWTNLEMQYTRDGADQPTPGRPTLDWILSYLRGLSGPMRDKAETYIRRAPAQTDTAHRRKIAEIFGWTPL